MQRHKQHVNNSDGGAPPNCICHIYHYTNSYRGYHDYCAFYGSCSYHQ